MDKYRKELGELNVDKNCIRVKKIEQIQEEAIRKIFDGIKNSKLIL